METLARALLTVVTLLVSTTLSAQPLPPELTRPVNDVARVIDSGSAATIERQIRALQQATGDVLVVATVDTYAPYGDIREYAVKMFENHGKGIGQRGKDNGILIVLALKEREVWVEVGYDLEQFITDGFAGEISRTDMVPAFRAGNYGAGLEAGVNRILGRIAQGRGVTIDGVRPPAERVAPDIVLSPGMIVAIIIGLMLLSTFGPRSRRRSRRRWGADPWSGWNSRVGPFGGGGGFGGGGFGGGFGGFGGGRSGGGGGGGRW